MNEIIAPATGIAVKLGRGDHLELIDPRGRQVSDLFCVDAYDPLHAYSSARTLDWNDTVFVTKGHALWSNRSERMLTIIDDTCGRHDLLMPPCSLRMFQLVAGNDRHHPSCHENLARALAPAGVAPDAIGCSFNAFMRVDVAPDGGLRIAEPESRPGDRIVFRAEMDLVVGLTACSHEGSNAGELKPIEFRVARAT